MYRNNYLMALLALWQNRSAMRVRAILERTNAFADPNEAEAAGIRLILPTPEITAEAGILWHSPIRRG